MFLTFPRLEESAMTNEQKAIVDSLYVQGHGYKKIASQLGISPNTVKSYLRKPRTAGAAPLVQEKTAAQLPTISITACQYCGTEVEQLQGRKEKRFCSDRCRNLWWNDHLNLVRRNAIYHFTCPACGKDFTVYGNAHRKYCCHACYIEDRFGGVR